MTRCLICNHDHTDPAGGHPDMAIELAARNDPAINRLGMGDSDEGLNVIMAYVAGVLKTETEWKEQHNCPGGVIPWSRR